MIRFLMLGTVDLRDTEGRELRAVLRRPKSLALLAYLGIARPAGFHRRDTLVALLWPELDHAHARNALRQAVHGLRGALGRDALISRSDEELGVNEELAWRDARAFERALDAGEAEKALELYRGSLLTGLHLSGVPEFERWLDDEREYLRRRACDAARLLTDRADAAGNATGAARWAQRLTELSPSDEAAVRRLVELLDRAGDRPGAMRAYEHFKRRLARDLELEPSSRTRALVSSIRARRQSGRVASVASANAAATSERATGGEAPTRDTTAKAADVAAGVSFRNRSLRRRLALAGLVTTIVGTLVVAWARALPSVDTTLLAVAPFDVHDPRLELWREGLVDVLARSLDGAGPFRTVPPTVVVRRWQGRADRESAVALAHGTGARFVVYGQLLTAGFDSVRLTAAVLDMRLGGPLIEVDRMDQADRIDRLIDSVSVDVIRTIMPATASTRIRLYSAGTRSLPALKAFLQGEYYFRRFALDSAVAGFYRAVALDTAFTLALHRLNGAIGWGGEGGAGPIDYLTRVRAVTHGLSPRDSLLGLGEWTGMGGAMPDHPAYVSNVRRRVSALEEAARRYPEDPEVWYQLGETRWHSGYVFGASGNDARAPFDRAIALDSSFAPAYIHPVEVALNDNDATAALRYVRAYLRIPSAHRERAGMRLLSTVLESGGSPAPDLDQALMAASPSALHRLADAVHSWPDEHETQLKVWPRALAAAGVTRIEGPAGTYAWPPPQASALATLFISRGHLRKARELLGDQLGVPFIQLAELGAIPSETVTRKFDRWVGEPEPDTLVYPFMLGTTMYHLFTLPCFVTMEAALWWAAGKDTARLRRLADREDAARVPRRSRVRQFALFERASPAVPVRTAGAQTVTAGDVAVRHPIGDFVRAALVLAEGDTAEALNRFLMFPDSFCPDAPRLREIRFRLLIANGRDSQAAAAFDRFNDRWIPLVLARAQLADRLGDTLTAVKYYQFVAQAWLHADAELQPVVADARSAILRLSGSSGTRANR